MFSTQAHQNICSLKWKENWVVIKKFLDCQKCPCAPARGLLQVAFTFFFSSPLVCNTMPCCLFYLFCFSFLFFFFFFFFLFLFWAVTLPFIFFWFFKVWATWFFFYMIFIFLINLGVCSFFVVICQVFVLIGHHSLKKVYE